ncbi:MAG TPA: hypothetical protein VJ464_15385 [Blastocatellia bacterium]|nr:hypothetical protein [Blastocatellia bacterium]
MRRLFILCAILCVWGGILSVWLMTFATSANPTSPRMVADNPCLTAHPEWLPTTPIPTFDQPPPHPEPDCPFYQAAWQTFLYATQPDSNGRPRFLSSYSTIEDLFGAPAAPEFAKEQSGILSLAPRTIQSPNEKPFPTSNHSPGIGAGINQAGLRGILIDQNGNPIYYAIHVNDVFANFIRQNGLTTKDALINADPEKLEFGQGAIELKSAWQIVNDDAPPSNYFTTKALVPRLKIQNGNLVVDNASRKVTVALIAIHVVFVLKNHPEFIWSTFEHIGADGHGIRDNAPAAPANPDLPGSTVISNSNWPLFKAGTSVAGANSPSSPQDLVNSFDETAQKFKKGVETSVYRMFTFSKSDDSLKVEGVLKFQEDGDIADLNMVMRQLFDTTPLDKKDKRRHYQLVGAVWLDNPGRDFKSNMLFQNLPGQGTDADGAMVAGEDRLSSTAMESFTQFDNPNCFSCHNTKRVTEDITHKPIVGPKRLNVSHVMSKFLADLK